MKRNLVLGIGFVALATPVLYLYLLLAGPGPAAAVTAVLPVTGTLVVVAVASFLLGWATIVTVSFPHSAAAPRWAEGGWKQLLLPRRRRHQTQNGLVYLVELATGVRIEYSDGLLQPLQFLRQLRMRRHGLTQPREGAHDVDAHLHRSLAVKDCSGHKGAVLSEGNWRVLAVRPTACV